MMRQVRKRLPLSLEKACNALYLVKVLGLSQTQAAVLLQLNVGQVSRVVSRQRFPQAKPVPPSLDAA